MVKEFKTIKGKTYYLKSRKTKKGNTTYYMTSKLDEACLNEVPKEYEVFEKYDLGVFYIRRKKPSKFSKKDIAIIENELKKCSSVDAYQLDVYGEEIKIYIAENANGLDLMMKKYFNASLDKNKVLAARNALLRYEERLKINFQDNNDFKGFEVMRYCYRGSIDDWIVIDAGEDLKELAEKNIFHLGKESYFDLYPIR